ncbi:Outer membrane efflux protein [compost metagenome]
MKTFLNVKKALTLVLVSAFLASTSLAAPEQSQIVRVNPESLRNMILDRNIGVMISMNQVQQAKTQVNIARGNLLPSISLGSILSSPASFLMNTVSSLLPFLMPSKWLDLKESTVLLEAQATSYYIAQLNTYASAYSLYLTVLGDIRLREAIYKQYLILSSIEVQMRRPAEIGVIPMENYLQAKAQAQLAMIQVSQLDALIKTEKATIRQMLNLTLDQEIVFDKVNVSPSPAEQATPQELLEPVHANSPETKQIDTMIRATYAGKWSKAFGIFSGASLGTQRGADGSFGDLSATGSVNFGFSYFPALELSNLNVKSYKLRKQQLKLEQAQLLETALGTMTEAHLQYNQASQAEENLTRVYETVQRQYQVGMTDLLHVFSIAKDLNNAIVYRVKAETNVELVRVNLHRALITDQFAQIKGCKLRRKKGGFFDPADKYKMSLDEACKKAR